MINVLLVFIYYQRRAELLNKNENVWIAIGILISGFGWLVPIWVTYFGIPLLIFYFFIASYFLFKPFNINQYIEKQI
jgi:Na+/citrate or Na+/malate symporter